MGKRFVVKVSAKPYNLKATFSRAVRGTKTAGSNKKYNGLCKGFVEFCEAYWDTHGGPRVYNEEIFAVFCNEVLMGESQDPNRIELYRSAILTAQDSDKVMLDENGAKWAASKAARAISDAYVNQKAEMRDEELRLAFSREMLAEASPSLMAQKQGKGLIEVAKVAIGAQLRFQEFIDLRIRDFNEEDSTIWVRKSKRKNVRFMKRKKDYSKGDTKVIVCPEAFEILKRQQLLRRSKESNSALPLFPPASHSIDKLLKSLKEFVKEQRASKSKTTVAKYFPTLVFDGAHCLRHGGCVWLREVMNVKSAEDINAIVACSPENFRKYSRSNKERARILKEQEGDEAPTSRYTETGEFGFGIMQGEHAEPAEKPVRGAAKDWLMKQAPPAASASAKGWLEQHHPVEQPKCAEAPDRERNVIAGNPIPSAKEWLEMQRGAAPAHPQEKKRSTNVKEWLERQSTAETAKAKPLEQDSDIEHATLEQLQEAEEAAGKEWNCIHDSPGMQTRKTRTRADSLRCWLDDLGKAISRKRPREETLEDL